MKSETAMQKRLKYLSQVTFLWTLVWWFFLCWGVRGGLRQSQKMCARLMAGD